MAKATDTPTKYVVQIDKLVKDAKAPKDSEKRFFAVGDVVTSEDLPGANVDALHAGGVLLTEDEHKKQAAA